MNGYLCDEAEDYAARIKQAMASFPTALSQKAYEDVLNIYNTHQMRKKYIDFYNSVCK